MALKKFGLMGYEIGGWGAALALIISIVGISLQARAYLLGPATTILPVWRLELACSKSTKAGCKDGSMLIVVADRLAFVNEGNAGYDTLIDPGQATVKLLSKRGQVLKEVRLRAQYFSKRVGKITREPASFILVPGGSAMDFEVEYFPRSFIQKDRTTNRENFYSFEDFKDALTMGIDGELIDTIVVMFEATARGRNRGRLNTSCTVVVDKRMRLNREVEPHAGSFPRNCFTEDQRL